MFGGRYAQEQGVEFEGESEVVDQTSDALFEQLWLVSRDAFENSGGPSSWLASRRLDSILRHTLSDPDSSVLCPGL